MKNNKPKRFGVFVYGFRFEITIVIVSEDLISWKKIVLEELYYEVLHNFLFVSKKNLLICPRKDWNDGSEEVFL